jgi:hypothetical protein
MFRTVSDHERVFYIQDSENWKKFLHSDGAVYRTIEYFPTRETAQAVLDKFQPEPKHEWKHGDVFRTESGFVMLCLFKNLGEQLYTYCLTERNFCEGHDWIEKNAKFLFNIKEKIDA